MSAERPRSADLRAAEPASPMADSHCSRHGSRRGYVLQRVRCSVPDFRSRGLMNVHARKTQKAVGGTCMVSGAWAMASHAGAKESRVIMYDDVATKKTTLWCSADSANTCWTDTPHGGGAVAHTGHAPHAQTATVRAPESPPPVGPLPKPPTSGASSTCARPRRARWPRGQRPRGPYSTTRRRSRRCCRCRLPRPRRSSVPARCSRR